MSVLFAKGGRAGSPDAIDAGAAPESAGPEDLTARTEESFPAVVAGRRLRFPRDFGAHPAFRTEWWYLTAWLEHPGGPLGLQLTFFRSRTPYGRENPSRFAPTQLVLAHAAIADPSLGALRHADQAFRANRVSGRYSTTDTDVAIGSASSHWELAREADDVYRMTVAARDFDFAITATPTDHFPGPVLQGDGGFSSKGPEPAQASYYYSRPQLALSGDITIEGVKNPVTGTGWLDHEWSSEIMDQRASGWDWVGLNFDNGDAMMAFQMRRRQSGLLHSTARYFRSAKAPGGKPVGENRDVRFTVLRVWRSARTGADYPVSMRIEAGEFDITLEPLFDDQELDTRRSTGIIYWEGAVRVHETVAGNLPDGAAGNLGPVIGRGYLELTGYANEVDL